MNYSFQRVSQKLLLHTKVVGHKQGESKIGWETGWYSGFPRIYFSQNKKPIPELQRMESLLTAQTSEINLLHFSLSPQ